MVRNYTSKQRRHHGGGRGRHGGGNLFTGNFLIGMFAIVAAGWFFFIGPGRGILAKVFNPSADLVNSSTTVPGLSAPTPLTPMSVPVVPTPLTPTTHVKHKSVENKAYV